MHLRFCFLRFDHSSEVRFYILAPTNINITILWSVTPVVRDVGASDADEFGPLIFGIGGSSPQPFCSPLSRLEFPWKVKIMAV